MASHYVLDYECHRRSTGFVRISRTCAKLLYALATKQSTMNIFYLLWRGEKSWGWGWGATYWHWMMRKAWERGYKTRCGFCLTTHYLYCTASNLQWLDAKVHSNGRNPRRCENTISVPSDNTCFPHTSISYKNNLKQIIVFRFHSDGWYHDFKVYASSLGVCKVGVCNSQSHIHDLADSWGVEKIRSVG